MGLYTHVFPLCNCWGILEEKQVEGFDIWHLHFFVILAQAFIVATVPVTVPLITKPDINVPMYGSISPLYNDQDYYQSNIHKPASSSVTVST